MMNKSKKYKYFVSYVYNTGNDVSLAHETVSSENIIDENTMKELIEVLAEKHNVNSNNLVILNIQRFPI